MVGLENVFVALSQLSVEQLIVSFFLTLLVSVSQSLRLYTLVKRWLLSAWGLIRLGFISQFFSNFLPGGFTGDLYKVYVFKAHNQRGITKSATLVLLDRFAGLASTFLVFGWSIFFIAELFYDLGRIYLITTVLAIGLVIAFVLWKHLPVKIKDKITSIGTTFKGLSSGQLQAFLVANLSVVGFRFLKFYLLSQLIGIDLSFIECAFLIVAVHLSSILPLSIGAYGLLEGAIVVVIVNYGYNVDQGVALAMLNRTGAWGCSLLGGADWLQAIIRKNRTN